MGRHGKPRIKLVLAVTVSIILHALSCIRGGYGASMAEVRTHHRPNCAFLPLTLT
jgi:hypothetical protein